MCTNLCMQYSIPAKTVSKLSGIPSARSKSVTSDTVSFSILKLLEYHYTQCYIWILFILFTHQLHPVQLCLFGQLLQIMSSTRIWFTSQDLQPGYPYIHVQLAFCSEESNSGAIITVISPYTKLIGPYDTKPT